MNLFHIIPDAQIILRSKNGVFQQRKLYRRGDRLYAGYGSGFVRIGGGDATSCPSVSWEGMDLPSSVVTRRGATGEPLITLSEVTERAA